MIKHHAGCWKREGIGFDCTCGAMDRLLAPDPHKIQVPAVNGVINDDMLDRIAREIALNVIEHVESMYPKAVVAAPGLMRSLNGCVRNEVTRWFGTPDAAVLGTPLDNRLRASAAHRRHMKRLRRINGTVSPGDAIEPLLAAHADSARQAGLEYRAGGPVIEGDADDAA